MSHGPVLLDLAGTSLTPEERELLLHPACGGVILFARNYENPAQLESLAGEIHAARTPPLLVCVDHEGGRVQRFRDGFTRLPPAGWFGCLYEESPARALRAARETGWLMAAELRAAGVDFSFAPVLDLGRGICAVIGDRAFHDKPQVVADLAHAWMSGMHDAGMPAVGKHFPGHGGVVEDSHLALPVDGRPVRDLMMEDVLPFERMIHYGLEAIMPAHVIYQNADDQPAGFSSYWLRRILREKLGFSGVIFSDDLTMAAAAAAGDDGARAEAALAAGCDVILVCNNPEGAVATLERLEAYENPTSQARVMRMHGRGAMHSRAHLHEDPRWREAVRIAAEHAETSLELNI
jgi:beta-N-acetylhexosaminidase